MKLLFKFDFANGWGDTFLSLFDIVNCINYVKENYPNFYIIFLINDNNSVDTLKLVLDFEFFNQISDEFNVLSKDSLFKNLNGIGWYKNEKFSRIYSGRNEDTKNNIPGIFDVFCLESNLNEIINLNIPFLNFTFNDIDDRVEYFPIFNKNLINLANDFIKDNFNSGFESIYFRALNPLNYENIDSFKNKLSKFVSKEKKYFMCSNSSLVKKIILDEGYNVIFFRNFKDHNLDHIPNGFTVFGQTVEDAIFPVTEMIILGESSKIIYSGDIQNVSLFNWYAINIKKVNLENIIL
jgi:hypothetical protein